MSRQRLSWDKEKVAEIMKQADPYTMNQTRTNPPAEKYRTGDPSAWGEDQHKATPWKNEGRTEDGHPAPAREAVVQARKLEDKALKCITIAQRMLPGAETDTLEDQATDLMFLPEKAILATLQRQSDLATKIAKEECPEEKKEEEEVEAKKKEEEEETACKKEEEEEEATASGKKKEEEEVEAGKKEKKEEEAVTAKKKEEEEEEATAAGKKKEEEEEVDAAKKKEEEEEVEAGKKEKKEEEEVSSAKKPVEEKEEEIKEASKDLLDILFDNAEVVAEAPKTGAKKLSGLVKQASGSDPLANLWDTPPDVSSVFHK